ncbi:MAG: alanine--tRNA ligase [Bacteroidales bacterium]|nr:alanine--tRNA ligase [Bacteroidales bacterium]
MKAAEVRRTFLDFFESKQHTLVPSAPMVVKNDPTLMFTNAGMNQFKDIFLGNTQVKDPRVANSQKCLRVSGKHNDLEEVGHDTYHHTMFEMLGNWSFGNYFKKEAIEWGWELLTEVYKINKEDLYITVFGGDQEDGTSLDQEAFDFWKAIVPEERILNGNKKDNFWEMGESGPCGPCSEIHIDMRSAAEKAKVPGRDLVNLDHPQVIEIWNLVFIQYNRLSNGKLVELPNKHVDTGMGFERLVRVLQNKTSNYDTDVFQPIIQKIAALAGKEYGKDETIDIAMRVMADHLRAITFAIADGQLPSNNKAGYVIRRILRRAVRYGYSFLDFREPIINKLVPLFVEQMGDFFPELKSQQDLITKVITEEEQSFLRTLENGINRLNQVISETVSHDYRVINGQVAFELYDTYGFPLDLTELILKEKNLIVSRREFDDEMTKQKDRSRAAASQETEDWIVLAEDDDEEFIGYDYTEAQIKITRYRKIITQKAELYQLVFNLTPFYAESGGQAGDVGYIENDNEKISIIDTKKENNLTVHIAKKIPENITSGFHAVVSKDKRIHSANNHTATHLVHYALRQVLGSHVEQKGSLVNSDNLRFDFSHFQKLTTEEITEVEKIVNKMIRQNIKLDEHRAMPVEEANKLGAMMLFGEKYGDLVRVVRYNESVELCGGIHAEATGQIGYFKIITEGAIAAGVRRIEAITAEKAEAFIFDQVQMINDIREVFKSSKDIVKSVQTLSEENKTLLKEIEILNREKALQIKDQLIKEVVNINGVNFISHRIKLGAGVVKDIAFALEREVENLFLIIGSEDKGKANITIMISENISKEKGLHAGKIIRELAKDIKGGGGGQAHFASAGGKDAQGIDKALSNALALIK